MKCKNLSHNPTRSGGNFYKNTNKRQPLNPHAGIKHSEIMRRQGVGGTVPINDRVATKSGFHANVFEGDNFVVRSEVVRAGNNSGIGVNTKSARVFYVTSGILYITSVSDTGVSVLNQYQPGSFYKAVPGQIYSYASSGLQDVEIMVIEDVKYENHWTLLEEGTVRKFSTESTSEVAPLYASQGRRKDQSIAKEQALKMSTGKRGRKSKASLNSAINNANSSTVIGVNPKPVIPTED